MSASPSVVTSRPAASHTILAVAEMQWRELLRRRVAMTLFLLLPAAFYYSIPADQDYGIVAGSIGVSWAVAAAGLFGTLGWRRIEPRLSLLGAGAWRRLLGRITVLVGLGLGLVAVFSGLILARSGVVIVDDQAFVGALALLALVSVPLGLAAGGLARGELEGTLVIIGIVGVQMSMPPDAPGAAALPLYGPVRLLEVAVGRGEVMAPAVAHTAVVVGLLVAVAWFGFRRHGVTRPPDRTSKEEPR